MPFQAFYFTCGDHSDIAVFITDKLKKNTKVSIGHHKLFFRGFSWSRTLAGLRIFKTVLTRIISIVHVLPSLANEDLHTSHDDELQSFFLSVKFGLVGMPASLQTIDDRSLLYFGEVGRKETPAEWLFIN